MKQASQKLDIHQLLPAPFAWLSIPGGSVTLDDPGGYLMAAKTLKVAPFSIAQYPITNAQYQVFIDAIDGYADARWWDYSKAAQEWHDENPHAKAVDFGEGDHPRTHVSWYEAQAFCRWLSVQTGEAVQLLSEAQWQYAAQGTKGYLYPWGNEWEAQRCQNGVETQNIGTASVQTYEGRGDSPFGVVDMIGNVWEWCLTSWDSGADSIEGDDVRVLRGGSWFDDVLGFFRTTRRRSWNPDIRSDLRGFRIVRASVDL